MDMAAFPLCPVCYELIVHPVTLPCEHELCLDCFKAGINGGILHCPLCRKRVSNWARQRAKDPVDGGRKRELESFYANFGSREDLELAVRLQQEEIDRQSRADGLEEKVEASYHGDDEVDVVAEQLKQDEEMARRLSTEDCIGDSDHNPSSQIQSDELMALDLHKALNEIKPAKSNKCHQVTLERWLKPR